MRDTLAMPDDRREIPQPIGRNPSEIPQQIVRPPRESGKNTNNFNKILWTSAMLCEQKPGKIRSEQRSFGISSCGSLRRSIDFGDARPYVPARATRPVPQGKSGISLSKEPR
jgi:hypothetical protein